VDLSELASFDGSIEDSFLFVDLLNSLLVFSLFFNLFPIGDLDL